jgi:hypothetical protein
MDRDGMGRPVLDVPDTRHENHGHALAKTDEDSYSLNNVSTLRRKEKMKIARLKEPQVTDVRGGKFYKSLHDKKHMKDIYHNCYIKNIEEMIKVRREGVLESLLGDSKGIYSKRKLIQDNLLT